MCNGLHFAFQFTLEIFYNVLLKGFVFQRDMGLLKYKLIDTWQCEQLYA